MRYKSLLLAGTFDGLHAGHRAILTRAFVEGERVTIGLTSDAFVRKFKRNVSLRDRSHGEAISTKGIAAATSWPRNDSIDIHPFEQRKRALGIWLDTKGFFDRATIIPIDDPYEPAASMTDLDALIVTAENRAIGERINLLRQGATLPSLTLIEVPMVEAEDGKPVSSTRMRNGEIDSDGRLIMPESMRGDLSKPLGRVLTALDVEHVLRSDLASQGPTLRITVGDIATKTFLDAGITPFLAIIDGMVGRKPFHETLKILQLQKVKPFRFRTVKSGPGYISKEAIRAIEKMPRVIFIDGEEDLLVLPAIIHAPLGSILYYGQPGEGLVEVVVTSSIKKQALALLGKFT